MWFKNSIYEEKKKRYLYSFLSKAENSEYKIYYNSNELNEIIKDLKRINVHGFILNTFEEKN